MKKSKQNEFKVKFAPFLLKWNKEQNRRKMPWKGEKDPYKIWLSEIILQQTRVEQGLGYYNNFIKTFPDIDKLAKAPDEKIIKLWEGLGYYTRCRNLIATAKMISKERKGVFPNTYEEILSLKGIGPYTAAAISSFAYNLPHAVVDGNVFRVLARVFGVPTPTDSTIGKKYFTALAEELLDKKQPGLYNQAIMDFGAVVCKPLAPLCHDCIFKKNCSAFIKDTITVLPVKEKKITIKKRWFYYVVMGYKNEVAIILRKSKDIWQDLYEFPLIETVKEMNEKNILKQLVLKKWLPKDAYELKGVSSEYRQQLSHQLINGRFIKIELNLKLSGNWKWIRKEKLTKYAFPQFINQYLKKSESKA